MLSSCEQDLPYWTCEESRIYGVGAIAELPLVDQALNDVHTVWWHIKK